MDSCTKKGFWHQIRTTKIFLIQPFWILSHLHLFVCVAKKKFRKIWKKFDIENWLWKSDLGPFWRPMRTFVKVKSKTYFCFTDFFTKMKPLLTHVNKTPPLRSHYGGYWLIYPFYPMYNVSWQSFSSTYFPMYFLFVL